MLNGNLYRVIVCDYFFFYLLPSLKKYILRTFMLMYSQAKGSATRDFNIVIVIIIIYSLINKMQVDY